MTRALVVGLGSIGLRHARILHAQGHAVAGVSRRGAAAVPPDLPIACHASLAAGIEGGPDYVVVATDTAEHETMLAELARLGFRGRVMVEKPLFARAAEIPENRFAALAVAYQFRRHPGLLGLRELLGDEPVLTASLYVGQHLSEWRPGRDYRTGYSASADRGGGALRDLSHELDYALWLLGPWRRVAALGGHFSGLEIASDDVFVLLMETARCRAATIEVNYVDRRPRRSLELRTDTRTLAFDFLSGALSENAAQLAMIKPERDEVMGAMHRDMIEGRIQGLCDGSQGAAVMGLIEAAETAAREQQWIAA